MSIKSVKPYYPGYFNPLHAVVDWSKVRSIIRALDRGEKLPPVYCDAADGSGNWLSGTHRVAASEIRCLLGRTADPYLDIGILNINDLDYDVQLMITTIHADDAETACDLLDNCGLDDAALRDKIETDYPWAIENNSQKESRYA
jgi:hypothetical protein